MDYDGLTTRLLAAIEETEQIAQAAIRWSEGASEWAVSSAGGWREPRLGPHRSP